MKVNIAGVGLVPKLGLLAPVYGKDLGRDDVNKILSYSSFKVYVAANGIQITKNNIDEVFGVTKPVAVEAAAPKKKTSKKAKKVEEPVKVEAPVVEEKPVEIKTVEEPEVLDTVVEAPAIEEPVEAVETPVNEEAIVDLDTPADTETVEAVAEEKPYYNKKKKKH